MAIVKYVQYKIGGNSTPSSMQEVINYCLQPHKTHYGEEDRLCAVSGLDCNPEFVFDEFMATKVLYGKENGIYFYHYVQAFHPDDELTPEEANRIGMELAKEWAGHEVLVATHVDRKHLHKLFYKGLSVYGTKPTTKSRLSRLLKELSGKRKAERKNLWNNT